MTTPTSRDHVEVRQGAYADSVALLQLSRTVQGIPGVVTAQVAMATPLNLEVLAQMGFAVPAGATPQEMVVALRLADDAADAVVADGRGRHHDGADHPRSLDRRRTSHRTRTTASALRGTVDGVVLVSVPGASALVEAMDAVDAGRDVMVFSDNVPVEQEVALKRAAAERGVLVMGPDCGTAVVGGARPRLRQRDVPRAGGRRGRVRHGLPAAALPARPRRRRGEPRPGRRWSRPLGRRWAGSPPGPPWPGSTRTRRSS